MVHPDVMEETAIQFWLLILAVPALLFAVAWILFEGAVEEMALLSPSCASGLSNI